MDKLVPERVQASRIERIEAETGVRVPAFVSDWPAIEQELAADLALANGLINKDWLIYVYGKLDHEEARYSASQAGLRFCRDHNVNVQEALRQAPTWERQRLSPTGLFIRYLQPDWDRGQLVSSEASRRARRDMDILHLETDLLRKRGVDVPELANLTDYCRWIIADMGVNEKYERWGREFREDGPMIYWDVMEHYSQIIKGARYSFDPLTDFESFLHGKKDLTPFEAWDLQNLGEADITYYAMSESWGGGARTRTADITFPSRLLTHTTSLNAARSIIESSYLEPRVCLSSGRVVSVRSHPEVTFIFDRQALAQLYSVREDGESTHENEVRSEELIHANMAIGCVPMSSALFPDTYGRSQGTQALGDLTLQRWEQNYLSTGSLWDQEEIKKIMAICQSHA